MDAWQSGPDTRVVGNLTIRCKRHIEVDAHEDTLSPKGDVAHPGDPIHGALLRHLDA